MFGFYALPSIETVYWFNLEVSQTVNYLFQPPAIVDKITENPIPRYDQSSFAAVKFSIVPNSDWPVVDFDYPFNFDKYTDPT